MAIGMTYEQYWFGDPLMVRAFFKAEKIRQQRINDEAWLHGAYVFRALEATVGNMMRPKGTTPAKYPEKPIELDLEDDTEQDREEREKQEALYAEAYMTNLVLAGKNWGKGEMHRGRNDQHPTD